MAAGPGVQAEGEGVDRQPLWAYRYRLEGRGSLRPQVGGFATRADALKALEKVLARLGPGGRAATMTLGELVDEYMEMHQAEPATIAKLRWLLGKATVTFGEVRLAELSPKDVYAWRLTIPEGHRFEATQALRQVLNRAVAGALIDYNPAKRGVPNPVRRSKEKRPFESWQDGGELEVDAVVWATGYRPDYSWIKLPVFDGDGRLRHRRGVPDVRGLYFLGLTWQQTRGSALIGWVRDDAEFIAERIAAYQETKARARREKVGAGTPA